MHAVGLGKGYFCTFQYYYKYVRIDQKPENTKAINFVNFNQMWTTTNKSLLQSFDFLYYP